MLEANKGLMEEWEGDEGMLEALMEIMEPQLRQREESGREEGRKEGISGAVEMLQGFGHNDPEIRVIIMEKYGLTEDEAAEFFNRVFLKPVVRLYFLNTILTSFYYKNAV